MFVTAGTFWHFWQDDRFVLAFLAVLAFPATTYLNVFPWGIEFFGVPVFIVAIFAAVAYPVSTFIGHLDPL